MTGIGIVGTVIGGVGAGSTALVILFDNRDSNDFKTDLHFETTGERRMGSVSKLIKRRYIIPLLLILSIVLLPCTFTIVDGRIVYRFTKTYSCSDINAEDNDFTNLSKLKNVEELRFSSAEMTNIDFVLGMKELRTILVSSYKITDYSVLGKCKNLESVLIHATPKFDLY